MGFDGIQEFLRRQITVCLDVMDNHDWRGVDGFLDEKQTRFINDLR